MRVHADLREHEHIQPVACNPRPGFLEITRQYDMYIAFQAFSAGAGAVAKRLVDRVVFVWRLAADVEDVNVESMAIEPRNDLIEQPPNRVGVEEGGHEPDPYTRGGGRRWGERRARHGVERR